MISRALTLLVTFSPLLNASVRSGHAEVEWQAATGTYQAGQTVETAIKMTVDVGWHTYWINPGEGGMKLGVTWELPDGWTAEEPQHPVPIRFMTGELPGFGYEGVVLFPVAITTPAGAQGPAELKAKVSWLTCNDSSCVPGDAELTLKLTPGAESTTDHAPDIRKAISAIPKARDGWLLQVKEQGKQLVLSIRPPDGDTTDLSNCTGFPATESVIDARAPIKFTKSDGLWTSEVPKDEYAGTPVKSLTLVVSGIGLEPPLELTWTAE